MLKIRLMGTKSDIVWFQRLIIYRSEFWKSPICMPTKEPTRTTDVTWKSQRKIQEKLQSNKEIKEN